MDQQTIQVINAMSPIERAMFYERMRAEGTPYINRRDVQLGNNSLGALAGKKRKKKKRTPEEKAAAKAAAKKEKAERLALHKLTSKKERRKIAKRAKKARKKLKSASGFIGDLNDGSQPGLPLTEAEERFRGFSVAGDFTGMNSMAPFGPNNWRRITPLGKYRFNINPDDSVNYIPWGEQDFINFLNGPWLIRNPETGLAPLLHPKRKIKVDKPGKLKKYLKKQQQAAQRHPPSSMRHITGITPGEYVYKSGETSAWVEFRAPILIAIAIVAAVYLGPMVLNAVKGMMAGSGAGGGAAAGGAGAAGTGGAATAGGVTAKATFASKVFAGAKTMTSYVNNARTVHAIAQGEAPPPPINVTGNNFTEWALAEAKNQIKKEAIERGAEYASDKMTASDEARLRREIQQMQGEIARLIPANVPLEPSPELSPAIKKIQAIEENKAAAQQKTLQMGLLIGIPLLLMMGG